MNLYFWKKSKTKRGKPVAEETFEDKMTAMMPFIVAAAPKIAGLIREARRNEDNAMEDALAPGDVVQSRGTQIGKLYDFFNNLGTHGVFENTDGWITTAGGNTTPMVPIGGVTTVSVDQTGRILGAAAMAPQTEETKNLPKVEITPKAVLHELETTLPIKGFNLEKLQEVIATLTDKERFCNQRFGKEQIKGLITRLENRKKYDQHYEFYRKFPNTTDSRIDKLLQKYKLLMKTTDLFIPTFPKEAIDVMKEYTDVTKGMCDEEPVFYVIAQEQDFKKKQEKLDPILLVQSPFGFFWQILGAWDEEMLLLSEL